MSRKENSRQKKKVTEEKQITKKVVDELIQ
jgi:hypothetical protein